MSKSSDEGLYPFERAPQAGLARYKIEMIIDVMEQRAIPAQKGDAWREGELMKINPRMLDLAIPNWIAEQLHEGEDILEYSIREIENEFNIRVNGIWRDKYGN